MCALEILHKVLSNVPSDFSLQIALDEAAFLLDLASIEGTWTDSLERIAECYKEAGLDEIARFIMYTD